MNYIIGSGWWATNDDIPRIKVGDDIIRSAKFHKLWYKSICKYTNPKKIFIVDSNSPIKPPLNRDDKRIEFVSLDRNYGHPTTTIGKLCGWTRAILLGVLYAQLCDVDYFVYVEQDTLLYGKNIIEYAIKNMNHPYIFGKGTGTPHYIQQSFFIIHKSGFDKFLRGIKRIRASDKEVSPETKFLKIRFNLFPPNLTPNIKVNGFLNVYWSKFTRRFWFDWLPFGYGRTKPINWNDPYFYFQHGMIEEIKKYMKLSRLKIDFKT